MPNSKKKGARGERELAHYLTDNGHPARRGQQYSGSPDSPDVICESLPGIHIECKRVERLQIHQAIEQAIDDAGDQTPVVAFKANRKPWLAILRLDDLLPLLERRS